MDPKGINLCAGANGIEHEQIAFRTKSCPLCKSIGDLVRMSDAKTDIDAENIAELFRGYDELHEKIDKICRHLGVEIPAKRRFWQRRLDWPLAYLEPPAELQPE